MGRKKTAVSKKSHKSTSPGNKAASRNYEYSQPANKNVVEEPEAVYQTEFPSGVAAIVKLLGGRALFHGFPSIKEIQDFIAIIRKGITRRSLDHLMFETGITPDEMAEIMHTSSRNLRRYTTDMVLSPAQSERAIELARLYSKGEDVFGSLDEFKQWMETSVLALGNKKPREFLDTSLGIDILLTELGRIEYGVFA